MKILYVNAPKYDVATALHIEGLLKQPDIDVRFTSRGNYAPQDRVLDHEDAIAFGNDEADVLILGSRYSPWKGAGANGEDAAAAFLRRSQKDDIDTFWRIRKKNILRVRMEGGDEAALGAGLLEFYRYRLIFKRELYQADWSLPALRYSMLPGSCGLWQALRAHPLMPFPHYHSMGNSLSLPLQARNIARNIFWLPGRRRVRPFPFGLEDRLRGKFNPAPEFELSCMLRPHSEERRRLLELLREKSYPKMFLDSIPPAREDIQWMVERGAAHPQAAKIGGIGFAQNRAYLAQLNNSRAAISIPGGGFDTLRFWEILGQGSLLISKRVAIQMPDPLQEGVHYMAFDTLAEFEKIMDWLYSYPEEADKIRKNGYEFALAYHTSDARARYFMNELERIDEPIH